MPAPSASTPFFPNLNQHLALDPSLRGPIPVGLTHPGLPILRPRNRELRLVKVGDGGDELMAFEANRLLDCAWYWGSHCWVLRGEVQMQKIRACSTVTPTFLSTGKKLFSVVGSLVFSCTEDLDSPSACNLSITNNRSNVRFCYTRTHDDESIIPAPQTYLKSVTFAPGPYARVQFEPRRNQKRCAFIIWIDGLQSRYLQTAVGRHIQYVDSSSVTAPHKLQWAAKNNKRDGTFILKVTIFSPFLKSMKFSKFIAIKFRIITRREGSPESQSMKPTTSYPYLKLTQVDNESTPLFFFNLLFSLHREAMNERENDSSPGLDNDAFTAIGHPSLVGQLQCLCFQMHIHHSQRLSCLQQSTYNHTHAPLLSYYCRRHHKKFQQ